MLSARRCLEQLNDAGLDDEAARLYLAENALRVFHLT
jgi:hypothetical protein